MRKEIADLVLDGSLAWRLTSTKTGYKNLQYLIGFNSIASRLIKYNGSKLLEDNNRIQPDMYGFSNNFIVISLSNTDSGFVEAYNPTPDEIKS